MRYQLRSRLELVIRTAVAALLVVALNGTAIAAPASEIKSARRHYELIDKQGGSYYEMTSISIVSSVQNDQIVLVRDHTYGDFIMERTHSFETGIKSVSISDAQRKAYIRLSWKGAGSGKTAENERKELANSTQTLTASSILTLETNGGRWQAAEDDWKSPAAVRELRSRVRAVMNPSLLEEIERMRGTVLKDDRTSFFQDLLTLYVLHGTAETGDVELSSNSLDPDCDFDRSFGYECTDKQLARIKKAKEEHRALQAY